MNVYNLSCLRPSTEDVIPWADHAVRGDSSTDSGGLRRDRRLVQFNISCIEFLGGVSVAIKASRLHYVLLKEKLRVHAEVSE